MPCAASLSMGCSVQVALPTSRITRAEFGGTYEEALMRILGVQHRGEPPVPGSKKANGDPAPGAKKASADPQAGDTLITGEV